MRVEIATLEDPRLDAYRGMRERDLASRGGKFIAEGEHVVRRLLASRFQVESVLLAQRRADEIAPLAPSEVPVYIAPSELLNRVVGFKFHSGVLAVGVRGPKLRIADICAPPDAGATTHPVGSRASASDTLAVCPEIANTENLGGLIRISAAFGARAMVLGEGSCDPFFRQSVRVSMGAVFTLPIVQSDDLARDLRCLREQHGFELVASVVHDPLGEPLERFHRADRTAVLFGNEAQGLSQAHMALCDRRVTIPMHLGTDSLNVAVAAGVILYHLTR